MSWVLYQFIDNMSNMFGIMKRVKPPRCYTMVYWTLWFPLRVSDINMPIIRSLRLYRWPQRVAPHLGYGGLLVWCMAVGLSVRLEGRCARASVYSKKDKQSANFDVFASVCWRFQTFWDIVLCRWVSLTMKLSEKQSFRPPSMTGIITSETRWGFSKPLCSI